MLKHREELPKIALNEMQVTRYEANPKSRFDIVEEIALAFNAAHVLGYGLRAQRIIQEDGVYYATWDIYGSCD